MSNSSVLDVKHVVLKSFAQYCSDCDSKRLHFVCNLR